MIVEECTDQDRNLADSKKSLLDCTLLTYGTGQTILHCGSSSVGRALAFQAKGRGFEPRLPLSDAVVAQLVQSSGFIAHRSVVRAYPTVHINKV